MLNERFLYLVAVITQHPNHVVKGRTRLQKTVKLLQRIGFPSNYDYEMHFYGPYSESLFMDLRLIDQLGFVSEQEDQAEDGNTRYIITANSSIPRKLLPDISQFDKQINIMAHAPSVILELAATFSAYHELGYENLGAWEKVKRKKGEKCSLQNQAQTISLLKSLGIAA